MAAELLPAIALDVASSGLSLDDLKARPVSGPELAATNSPGNIQNGYVIPYFDINGNNIPFYRVKLINHDPKYKQPKDTQNHVYFPPTFKKTLANQLDDMNGYPEPFVIITEGEKKAAAGCKNGFPTVGVGGVDSWRNRTIVLPAETKLTASTGSKKIISATIPSQETVHEFSTLAVGLQSLLDLVNEEHLTIFLAFDTDSPNSPSIPKVQRAAAMFGYELRYRGVPTQRIRQLLLPRIKAGKVGLDDYLIVKDGPINLEKLINQNFEQKYTFPRHPNPRSFIASRLERNRLSRKDRQEVSFVVLAELDARGQRLTSTIDSSPYFFDETSKKLMPASFQNHAGVFYHESPFGKFLYAEYGLSGADHPTLAWLASQFTGEQPMSTVEPRKVVSLGVEEEDTVAMQLNDSSFALCTPSTANPVEILSNGSKGLLFEQDMVEPIDTDIFKAKLKEELAKPALIPYWLEAINTTHVKGEQNRKLQALLCYLNPWLNRWRSLQLPVEILFGEPNSGKSSMFELRLQIMTGKPKLRNIPADLRDWYAGITNTGGMYIIDNVQFADKGLRQKLSDEICRLITEPDPHIELRKLYTTSGQMDAPVRSTFGFTAVMQPFLNADLIQRAAIFEMEAHDTPISGWVEDTLELYGGREGWLAHHAAVLHKFLKLAVANKQWSSNFQSQHRLSFYEQCLTIMARVFGMETDWIYPALATATQKMMSEADWTLEGLKAFVDKAGEVAPGAVIGTNEISAWCMGTEDFADNQTLCNSRRLGRYLTSHKHIVERTCGLVEAGKQNNRTMYKVRPLKKS